MRKRRILLQLSFLGLYGTYEELKRYRPVGGETDGASLYGTYEELKRLADVYNQIAQLIGLYGTYEELKLVIYSRCSNKPAPFVWYL